jgi:TetR/AcrR family transcriptional regulator, regulator of autoinduction and epiphytic fitness
MVIAEERSIKRDTSQKRETILEAAVQVFIEEGYDNASMDRIAERANASKRTVYNHFSSKDALFQTILAKFIGEQQALKQIPFDPKRRLEDQLSDFADAVLFMVNTPAHLGLSRILTAMFTREPEKATAARAEFAPLEDELERWIRDAVVAGYLEAPNPVLATKVFYGMIEGTLSYPALTDCVDPETVEPLKQELIATFLSRYGKHCSSVR